MLKTTVFVIGLVLPGAVLAADATAPVREIMTITESNWSESGAEYQDIFDASRLKMLFSSGFAERYGKAMQGEYARESGSPFDFDVIVNGQDGCPLKNVTITAAPVQGAVTEVTARFQAMTCFGQEAEYQGYNETRFNVISENGKPVVDDIVLSMDGAPFSIKGELEAMGKQ
jgi:hypothetical protein